VITPIGFSASQLLEGELELVVELSFPVQGTSLPADHNYGLYAAIVHQIPDFHRHSSISLLTVPGFPNHEGEITLIKQSCFKIRVPLPKIPLVYPLAGKRVTIGKHEIQIGIPEISVLHTAQKLRARIVIIKGYTEPESFLQAAQRQLEQLRIMGQITIPPNHKGQPSRKTIKIKCHTLVGFTTEVADLSLEDSLKLQAYGLGGKRRMGCGVFLPVQGGR